MNSTLPTILAGDLNAKHVAWHSHSINSAGRTLYSSMDNGEFNVFAPTTPTHYPDQTNYRPDVLDITIMKNINLPFDFDNLNDLSSDHNPIVINLQGRSRSSYIPSTKLVTNWNRFAVNLHTIITNPNPTISTRSDVDLAVENLTSKILSCLEANTKTVQIKPPQLQLPLNIQQEINKKRRLRRAWHHSRNPDIKRNYNHQTQKVKILLENHRTNKWDSLLASLKPNDPKIYKINKSLINRKSPNQPIRNQQGLVYDPKDKAELFADTLAAQFTCPPNPSIHEDEVEETTHNINSRGVTPIQPISPNEIKSIFKHLPRRKAPGPDMIPNVALRHCSEKTILHITKIYNSCLRLKYFPKMWKKATVIMIPKSGKDLKNPSNHRPISLINTLAKVLEIAITTRLRLCINTKLRPEQFAFRSEHSTTNQLMKLVDYLTNTMNRGEKTTAVLLDLEKAFDKVWHIGLLYKLLKLDTPPALVALIQSFLENRCFSVRVENQYSDPRKMAAGVPQGSCLSPLLFMIFINDIPSNQGTHLNLYADDTMLYSTSISINHAARKLQIHLDKVLYWLKEWKLSLNTIKTEAIRFGRRLKKATPLSIDGSMIPWQNHIKYLGVNLDSKLRFNLHTTQITRKARQTRGALYPLLNIRSPLPMKTKISIYKMYIRTKITYAGPAWAAQISNSNWEKIEAIQNISLRTITGLPWYVRNTTLKTSLSIPSIKDDIKTATIRLFHKLKQSRHEHLKNIGLTIGLLNYTDHARNH